MSRPPVSLTILILYSGFCFASKSANSTLWKQIQYSGKHLDLATSTSVVSSPQKCAENCLCDPPCKSFGIHLPDLRCSLYDGRVWAGRNGTVESGWFYYWLLEASCPIEKGYIMNPDKTVCYKYYYVKMNWKDAQDRCEEDGGHLFLGDTKEKRDLLNRLKRLPGNLGVVYLGATDEFEEGVWNWLNGVPINPGDFYHGDPNNYLGNQHCLFTLKDDFRDGYCSYLESFVCEVPLYPKL